MSERVPKTKSWVALYHKCVHEFSSYTDVYLCVRLCLCLCVFVCVCVCVYVCDLLSVFFSSLFAPGYREAGRKQSGAGGVMERGGGRGGGKKGDRQIDGGHVGKKRKN